MDLPDLQVQVKPDSRGYYRCPYDCWTSASPWPRPKWKTLAGIQKHMAGCAFAPPPEWIPPPVPPPVLFGTCICGAAVNEGEPIWIMLKTWRCFDCMYMMTVTGEIEGTGYMDCAGLKLAGFEDIVA